MGDIWLPGLPPAYSSWQECFNLLLPLMPTREDAVILAAIAGPESGYDYRVINDTPATGDYSVGLFEINYYATLYPSRAAEFGTPRELILSGVKGQCEAAAKLWHDAGGFSPWAADILNNTWQQYVGSGPVPANPGLGGPGGGPPAITFDTTQIKHAARELAKVAQLTAIRGQAIGRIRVKGLRP